MPLRRCFGFESPVVSPPGDRRAHDERLARRRLDHLAEVPLGEMARMRREAVEVVLADRVAAGRVVVGPRHVRVGSSAVHLGTARVTRGGEQVELDLPDVGSPLAAVPWLPYDERLLQRVVRAVGALLAERA